VYDDGVAVPAREQVEPAEISGYAADNLLYIRQAMERSSTFTSIPGIGGALMGVVALIAAAVAGAQQTSERWLLTWIAAAIVAATVGLVTMGLKAKRAGSTLTGATAKRFALGMAAPFVAGAAITFQLWSVGAYAVMAPAWLLLYGAGVLTGGIFSVPIVRVIGVCFMMLGVLAIATPSAWGNLWLAAGFGGLQVAFGAYIARHHGG